MKSRYPYLLTMPVFWVVLGVLLLTVGMPWTYPLFSMLFPELERPIYVQDSFVHLLLSHVWIVAVSSMVSMGLGILAGWFVTRSFGKEFRHLIDSTVAVGQTLPPVAVLAIAAPLVGFGALPALIALALYGLLPIMEAAIAGFSSVPNSVKEAAAGLGMSDTQIFREVEWPLAWPLLLSGIRVSVSINIGTAAIASTVGAKTLGTPIIVGLTGYNTAYVLQGAVLVGGVAVAVDMLLGLLSKDGVDHNRSSWEC